MSELEQHTGISQERILFCRVHTHSAPVTGDRPFEVPNYIAKKPLEVKEATKLYEQLIFDKLLLASDRAIKNMVPARYGCTYGKSYVNVNRVGLYEVCEEDGNCHLQVETGTNFEREADRTLFVMKFEDLNQRPIAFFINYPVHNTVMILNSCGKGGKVGITSDLGGNVSQWMENAYADSVALWSSGAAGDINSLMSNQLYREVPKTGAPLNTTKKM